MNPITVPLTHHMQVGYPGIAAGLEVRGGCRALPWETTVRGQTLEETGA